MCDRAVKITCVRGRVSPGHSIPKRAAARRKPELGLGLSKRYRLEKGITPSAYLPVSIYCYSISAASHLQGQPNVAPSEQLIYEVEENQISDNCAPEAIFRTPFL